MLKLHGVPGNSGHTPATEEINKKKFLRTITVSIVALIITIIWILSSVGTIPGLWATILSILATIISFIVGILPYIVAKHDPPPEQSTVLALAPVIKKIHADLLASPPATSAPVTYHAMAGLPPPTNAKAIQQRQQEVNDIYTRVIQEDTTAIVLTGIGGIGKSTLAALTYHYAEAQRLQGAGPFTAAPLWLRVDPAMTMTDLIGTLFELMGKPLLSFHTMLPQEQATRLFNLLNTSDQARLIVLDQFENLLDWQTGHARDSQSGISEWIDALNSQPCRCRILLTSRPWPKGTREYPPLYMQEYRVGGLTASEGMNLLRQQQVEGTDEELQKAVTYCSGHAFALILLALLMRNHNLNLRTLFLDDMYTQLWEGDIARNLLDNIYMQQLNQLQRRLLSSFSIYREPVRLDAACAILEMESGTSAIQTALYAVLGQHLLQATGNGYYQLHSMVASYAQTHFDESNDQVNQLLLSAAHGKAASYYRQQAALTSPDKEKRRNINDIHTLLEAIWHHIQAQQAQEAYDLLIHEEIFPALKRCGANATLLEICQTLLQSGQWARKSSQRAYLYNNQGDACLVLGQMEQSKHNYNQTLQICQDITDPSAEAWALNNLGRIYNTLGQSEKAQEHLEQALKLFKQASNHPGEGRCFTNLGWLYYDRGNIEQAQYYFEQALIIFKDEDDQREEGFTYGYLGRVHSDIGQSKLAKKYYARALEVLSAIGDRSGMGIMLSNQGRIYNVLGHHKQALEYLEQALTILREVGDRNSEATALNDLGRVYTDLGQKEFAIQSFEQALLIRKEVGNRRGEARALTDLGKIYTNLKQMEKAKDYFEQALQVLDNIEHSWRDGRTLKNLGKVYLLMQKNDLALQCYAKALQNYMRIGNQWETGIILFELGLLYFAHQRYDTALPFFILAKNSDQEVEGAYGHKIQEQITLTSKKISQEKLNLLLSSPPSQMQQIVNKTLAEANA